MKVDAILLAAGRSTRMGERNKLLQELDGRSLVRRAADTLKSSRVREVVVVTGHEAAEVAAVLAGLEVRVVHNPDFAQGMATSLRVGILALRADSEGVVIALGDMPLSTTAHINALVTTFETHPTGFCAPTYRGRRGNPVLWSQAFYPEMSALTGDQGARALLKTHAEHLHTVEMGDDGVLVDVDTIDEMMRLASR